MPIKLIGTIILLVVVTVFCGFNMENKCDVNFVFKNFEQVPIFLSLLVAFLCGSLIMVPFTIGKGRKSKKQNKKQNEEVKPVVVVSENDEEADKTIFDFKIKKEAKKEKKEIKKAKKEKKADEIPVDNGVVVKNEAPESEKQDSQEIKADFSKF